MYSSPFTSLLKKSIINLMDKRMISLLQESNKLGKYFCFKCKIEEYAAKKFLKRCSKCDSIMRPILPKSVKIIQ